MWTEVLFKEIFLLDGPKFNLTIFRRHRGSEDEYFSPAYEDIVCSGKGHLNSLRTRVYSGVHFVLATSFNWIPDHLFFQLGHCSRLSSTLFVVNMVGYDYRRDMKKRIAKECYEC